MIDKNLAYFYNRNPKLSPWFEKQFDILIERGVYHNNIEALANNLINELKQYSTKNNINDVVIGLSGGIDSAVTAKLFKLAGWNVHGLLLPIHQDPAETERGVEVAQSIGIEPVIVDLTDAYEYLRTHGPNTVDSEISNDVTADTSRNIKIRLGNMRARLRMITLYNLAGKVKGLVASTDNFSELAAGFWTLHGDVGDVAPIQSLSKSWEVPALAQYLNVPVSVISAVPTDGLGIANGDEDQFGFSYLEFDIGLFSIFADPTIEPESSEDQRIIDNIKLRLTSSKYKRTNPTNLLHPFDTSRYNRLELIDNTLRR